MNNYFVYRHIRLDTNTIFYIGIGKISQRKDATTFKLKHYRAYLKYKRNSIWKYITRKTNYLVEIIFDNITLDKAKNIEIELISKYGKICDKTGILSNITDGGENIPDSIITKENDPKCSRPIYQYTLTGKFIKMWPSTNQVSRELGFDNSVILKSIKGKTKSKNTSYGFQWFFEFKGDFISPSDSGKITLHKAVFAQKDSDVKIFNSREECARFFGVKSAQVTNAINKKWKLRNFKILNYEKN